MTRVIGKEYHDFHKLGVRVRIVTLKKSIPVFFGDLYSNVNVEEIQGSPDQFTNIDPSSQNLTRISIGTVLSTIKLMAKIHARLIRLNPDAIVYHEIAPVILSLPYLFLKGTKFSIYLHDNSFSPIIPGKNIITNFKRATIRFFIKIAIRKSQTTFCVSPTLSNSIINNTNSRNVEFLPLGVDTVDCVLPELRKRFILTYSFWDRWRKPETYLDLLEHVPDQITLIVAGRWHDASFQDEFKRSLKSRCITNRVKLIEEMSESYKNELLTNAIAFVRFGFEEKGTPGGILEAFGSGCPVIVNRELGGASIIQNEENGFVVDTIAEAGKIIRRLIADRDLFYSISENAYATARQLSWRVHTNKILKGLNIL